MEVRVSYVTPNGIGVAKADLNIVSAMSYFEGEIHHADMESIIMICVPHKRNTKAFFAAYNIDIKKRDEIMPELLMNATLVITGSEALTSWGETYTIETRDNKQFIITPDPDVEIEIRDVMEIHTNRRGMTYLAAIRGAIMSPELSIKISK